MRFLVLKGHFCEDWSEFDFDPGDETAVGEAPRCQTCGRFTGMLQFLPPLRGTLIAERSLFDLSADGEKVLVSERCLKEFEKNGIRGLVNPQPIEFRAVQGPFDLAKVGRFFWAETERGAEIDRARSGLITKPEEFCPECGLSDLIEGYDRVAIIDSSWDGRDLFSVKGIPGVVLTTERVDKLCRQLGLKVCGLAPAEEYFAPWTKPRQTGDAPQMR